MPHAQTQRPSLKARLAQIGLVPPPAAPRSKMPPPRGSAVGTVHFGGQLEALRFRGGTDEAAAPPAHTIAALTSGVLQHATMSPETGTPRRGRRQSMLLDVHVAIERKGKKATAYNHFFDNDFRPQFYWFRQLHFIVLLALNTLQTFLSGLPAHALYALPLYGSTMLVLVLYFVVLIWFRPMLHDESWKLPTKLGAVVVSAVGATLNLLATLNEPSFVGFAVDPDHMEMALIPTTWRWRSVA